MNPRSCLAAPLEQASLNWRGLFASLLIVLMLPACGANSNKARNSGPSFPNLSKFEKEIGYSEFILNREVTMLMLDRYYSDLEKVLVLHNKVGRYWLALHVDSSSDNSAYVHVFEFNETNRWKFIKTFNGKESLFESLGFIEDTYGLFSVTSI